MTEFYTFNEAVAKTGLSKTRISHMVNGYTYRRGPKEAPIYTREVPPKLKEGEHYVWVRSRAHWKIMFTAKGIAVMTEQKRDST